ncbi:MAG: hypothetical protein J7L12_01920 [Desulfurococcales archaeon]|nr:hypothetical protein [Desulfurococcales archaeon]
MKHSGDGQPGIRALAIILLISVTTSAVVAVQVSSSRITAYDVFSNSQGTVVALGNKVVYLNSSKITVIRLEDSKVRVFSTVIGSSGSEILLAGSYGRHPLLGVIKLGREVRTSIYISDLINGSFFKLRLINGCLYCTGYVFDGQVYSGLIVVLNESELMSGNSVISTKALITSCKGSSYIRDVTELPSNEVVALGACYSVSLYPKYQLMLLILSEGLGVCRSYILESESSLVPKGVFVVERNNIVCVAVSENAVGYIKLTSSEISEEGRVEINLLPLKNSLLSITAVSSDDVIYVLARTSRSQYIFGISPSSTAIELTEVENANPVAILLRNGEPALLASNLSSYRVESISGITHIVEPADVEYSKLSDVWVEIKVKELVLKHVETKELVANIVSVVPVAQGGGGGWSESTASLTATERAHRGGAGSSVGEGFRKDVEAATLSNHYILALSLALISAYLILRSRLSRTLT